MIKKSFMKKTFLSFLKTLGRFLIFLSLFPSLEAFSQGPSPSQSFEDPFSLFVLSFFSLICIFGCFLAIKRKSKNYSYFTLYIVSLFIFTFFSFGSEPKEGLPFMGTHLSFSLLLAGLFLWIPEYLKWEERDF